MFDNDVMWYWFTGALAFGVLECFVEGFVALGLAATCFVVGVLSTIPDIYQNMAAGHFLGLAALIVGGFFYFGNRLFWGDREISFVTPLGTKFKDKIVGQVAVLREPIASGRGRVEANGTLWKCLAPEDLPAGATVVVADIRGNTLLVKRLEGG